MNKSACQHEMYATASILLTDAPVEVSFDRRHHPGRSSDSSADGSAATSLPAGSIFRSTASPASTTTRRPPRHEQIARSIRAMFACGVTRFFPTVITGSPENMIGALRNLAAAKESIPEGAAMEAFHVEGPYISPEDGPRGAHPARWVRPPDLDEFQRFQEAARGNIRLVTLSPEWPEAPALHREARPRTAWSSASATPRASAAQIADAVSAGATLSTHLGNGAHAVLPTPSELHLGSTRRRPPGGQLHRGRIPSSAQRS